MHIRYALFAALFTLCCADAVTARHELWRRQDPAPASSPASNNPPPSSSVSSSTQSTNNGKSKTDQSGSSKTQGDRTPTITTDPQSNHSSNGNSTAAKDTSDQELPLKPSITPAVAIIGTVLILTGVAYCIIGIKHEWLLVFLSSAYVASLGITVLILYVMNPPVSDAIQGAYFVAAFMTGVIFGGFALIFREVTGGFGCLVGGFCLSMWFLCLKPGGLVTSSTGKAIMIGVFSVAGWSLAFSQYTRNYGIIFCTAFGGAMLTIIGIDCFTRAGLKEFWIYIWHLNADEFPLHTNTYPITRAMRAELACTIVLCVLGIISQLKVWKMVKERKAKKEEERMQDEESRDKRDSRMGKRIEERNSRSLAAWEAVYGDKDSSAVTGDSRAGTSMDTLKISASVREREIDAIELEELATPTEAGKDKSKSYVTTQAVKEGETPRATPGLELDLDSNYGDFQWWKDFRSAKTSPNHSRKGSVEPFDANEPAVPALPFSPLMEQDGVGRSESRIRSTAPTPVPEGQASRPADGRGSKLAETREQPEDDEHNSFEISRIEDDRASSIAATADEDGPDFDALSTKRLSMFSVAASARMSRCADDLKEFPLPTAPRTPGESPMTEKDNEELLLPVSSDKNKGAETTNEDEKPKEKEQKAELTDSNLPSGISKVANVYRTNEWAKHIAEADQPEILEDLNPEEPSIHVDVGRTEETPRPVEAVALSPEQQPQFFRTASNPYRRNSDGYRRPASAASGAVPIYSVSRQNSQTLERNRSRQEMRSPSRALVQAPFVETPSEDGFASTINLMDERNLRNSVKPTTTNFNGIRPASSMGILSPPEAAVLQAQNRESDVVSPADMTREQRKSILLAQMVSDQQQRLQHRTSTQRPSNSRPPNAANNHASLIYDSHQPKRVNSVDTIKQNAMLTQWRQSLSRETYNQPDVVDGARARQSMIDQLRYRDYQELKKESERKKRESKRDLAMRTSQLTDKHRAAMRRMQSQSEGVGGGVKK